MKETFSNNLKQFRKQKQLSQEQLAEQLGITTQAVSKWECGLSYPDIDLLPRLADLFCVSIDTLLRGSLTDTEPDSDPSDHADDISHTTHDNIPLPEPDLPDDDILRIVQYRGKTLLRKDTYDPKIRIPLSMTQKNRTNFFHKNESVTIRIQDTPSVEIWGSAELFGDLSGDVTANGDVSCRGDIGGSVTAGHNISCDGDIDGPVNASSGSISCAGDIGGDVTAAGSVSCGGDIDGSVKASGSVSCGGDIDGNVSVGGNVDCGGDIDGNVNAGGYVSHN